MMRRFALAAAMTVFAGCSSGAQYDGPVSDHFDGERFHNDESFDVGWGDLWRYYRERQPGEWTRDLTPAGQPAPPVRVGRGELVVTVVNHATVLIQLDGVNILTDPIWSDRASPVQWLGPKRYVAPGLRFDQLPPIDAVLLSHDHYDHLDLPTLRLLEAVHQPVFLVGLGEDGWLRDAGLGRVVAMDWGDAHRLGPRVTAHGQRAKHWTGRGFGKAQRNRSLWLAYVIEAPGGPVYFSGDTGYDDHFAESGARFGPFRLALLPIGAYQPRWLTAYQHTSPADAVQAHRDLNAARSLGVHFGTFQLSEEGQQQPVADLAQAVSAAGLSDSAFVAPVFGRAYRIDPLP
jgi:L-ascorbate metabolism protein UlaG (beta-lactamase superfamily)